MTSMLLLAAAAAPALAPQTQAELRTVEAAVARYRDFAVAEREGWKKFGGDGPMVGEHWFLPPEKGGLDYRAGQPLDLRRPSNLMYTWINGRRVLTGVTFNVRIGPRDPVPAGFTGNADPWHVHDFRAAVAAATKDRPVLRWLANGWLNQNWKGQERVAMLHVWVGGPANPDGPFAHYNRALPYLKLNLPAAYAAGASMGAAKGLSLATDKGCAEQIDGALWIANAGRSKARLHAACKAAADHVRPVLATRDPRQINTMAEHAWAMFDAAWKRELSPEQQARIAAITEHDHPVRQTPPGQPDPHAGHHKH